MKNKFLRVITSMPVLLPAIVIIPVALSVLAYVASPNNRFNNETYKGHHIEGDAESFKLEKVDKLFKINNYSTWSNYQGGAFYNNFYCLAANNLENLIIYDMKTYKLEEVVSEADTNNSYHCNTIAFGTTFYSRKDKFPLLYISMENSDVHCTNVYRIARRSTNYYLELLQEIVFPAANECGVYLPNSYIDHNNALETDGLELGKPYLYYSGYTQNSYKQADNNKLRFFRFDLPKAPKEGTDYPFTVNLKDQVLDQIKNNKYHDVPSQTATQG
ncbi:MAG: hypothetical protein K6F07_03080, partial [Bacilli bacterium]|nr:hypothetical protein [Bacilli bacterium]